MHSQFDLEIAIESVAVSLSAATETATHLKIQLKSLKSSLNGFRATTTLYILVFTE